MDIKLNKGVSGSRKRGRKGAALKVYLSGARIGKFKFLITITSLSIDGGKFKKCNLNLGLQVVFFECI